MIKGRVIVASNRAWAGVYADSSGPIIVAGLRQLGLQRDVVPRVAAEDARLLARVDPRIGIDPIRNLGGIVAPAQIAEIVGGWWRGDGVETGGVCHDPFRLRTSSCTSMKCKPCAAGRVFGVALARSVELNGS